MKLDESIWQLPKGEKNCITDVGGVKVGHVTLDEALPDGECVCTGVTAVLPHSENLFREKVHGAGVVLNGFGKTSGLIQLNELGLLESPVMLTNTFAVPAVTEGTLGYLLRQSPEIGDTTGTVNTVTGECNDGYLNSIRHFSVKPEHAVEAIETAGPQPSAEGAVGAGKGMVCFGMKGGIGTASRSVDGFTVGALVLSNFGKRSEFNEKRYRKEGEPNQSGGTDPKTDGSIMIVLATDAPLEHRRLTRVAKRCAIGLGRTGSHMSHGSGDIVIAFSTAGRYPHHSDRLNEQESFLRDDHPVMNSLFTAAAEAVEEAIVRSLIKAETTKGRRGRTVEGWS
ncbi:P1 family peptidase [Alteribacter natronophilus]|uniref:P1 family peptidase n=1 Tax=Alteribacter natronophilus TaxID=2583810 RepID=UPI00110E213A|nr:P1 family peptidase [Alteribacter natronophilus]TMW71841.1 S58 family peptidase [Alteribacter natronophilus]